MFVWLFLLLALIYSIHNWFQKRRRLPPGPFALPIVGNLLEIGLEAPGTQFLERCHKKYGPIFTYYLGNTPFVALADHETIMEVLVKNGDACTDREFFDDFYRMIRGNSDGIFNLNGDTWKEHSNFIHKSFRQSGIGSEEFEQKIIGELEWLFGEVDKDLIENQGCAMNLAQNVDVFIGSTVNLWLFGYTFGGERSEEFLNIKRCVVEFMSYSGELLPTLVRCCPNLLAQLPFFRTAVEEIRRLVFALHVYFQKQIQGLRDNKIDIINEENSFGENSYVRTFLAEAKLRNGEDNFDAGTLIGILRDMWIAGQDTVTNTEIQRLANLVAFNIPRKTTRRLNVRDYVLEPGTAVSACISLLFYDEKIFPEPHSFVPERFLAENGQPKRIDEFIPFSVGRRLCIGRDLAKVELYTFFANFMNRYQVLPSTKHPLPSLKRNFGISVKADKFYCNLRQRFQ